MPDVSLSLPSGGAQQQVVVGSNAPGSGAVELRIANGTSHEEVKRALRAIESRVRTDLTTG